MANTLKLPCTRARRTPIASAVMLSLLSLAMQAQAQGAASASPARPAAPPVPAQAEPAQLQLQSIEVTANRRIEKLEKVPQSISVISMEDIERRNVREFEDLTTVAPALTISTGTQVGTNSINMRGIGTTSNNLGIEGDVAVILDDLPFAQPQQAFKDLHDVARIEVLKGPQSTLFGKSSIAGAVVVTTAPIGSGPLRTKLSAYRTSDHEYRLAGSLSGRVGERVGLRLSASKSDFRGLLRNLTTGGYMNGSGGENFNAKLEWNVNNDFDVSLYGFYSDSKATGNTSVLISMDNREGSLIRNNPNLTNTIIFRGITPSKRNRNVRLDDESSLAQKDWGTALRMNYVFPDKSALAGHTLTSITGFNSNDSNDRRDNDGHDLVIAQYIPLTNAAGVTAPSSQPSGLKETAQINGLAFIKTYTQDLRLTSPDSGNFRYLLGLWYAKTSLERFYLRGIYGIKPTNYTNYETTSDVQNLALYANSTWEFRPRHTLTLGGRLNRETNNYTFTTISALAATAPANTPYTPYHHYVAPEHSESAFTGKAAYAYSVSAETMVYASYATGRKGVAYDMTSGANNKNVFNFLPLAAETAESVELGLKANLLGNRATLNVALFHSDFKNYQASSTQTFSDGSSASVLYGIPEVQTKGFEVDFKILASRQLTLAANYAYTEATITDWPFGACYSGRPGCTTTPPNPRNPTASYYNGAGFKMPNSPRHKGLVSAQYSSNLGPFKASYNAQVRSQSDVLGNIDQNPTHFRPGITIVDAGMSLATRDNRYKLSLGVRNLFDKQYATGGQGGVVGTLFAPTGAPSSANIAQNGWKPARDAFRYYTVRFDMNF